MQADLLTTVILPASLFVIMLGMGLALKPIDFKMVILRPKAVLIGLVAQMLILPLIAYGIVMLLGMTGALAVGMMILALCPGGTTSNLYTYLAKGDIALSVTLTSIVSLLAPFTVPLFIVLFIDIFMGTEGAVPLDVLETIKKLVAITIIPISIGMIINHYKPVFAEKAEKPAKYFSIIFLFLIVVVISVKNISEMGNYFAQAGLATILLNVACMVVGYGAAKLAKLNEAQSKAIGIEVGFQNGTLAIMIALTILGNTEMAIAATTYSIVMFITGALFAWILNKESKEPVEVNA